MSDPLDAPELDVPEIVHWSPRHGAVVGGPPHGPRTWPLTATGAMAVGALGLVALSIGALAIGALAVGRLAIGRARLKDVKIGRLEVGDLIVVRRNGRAF
jgi:hypothetical protein